MTTKVTIALAALGIGALLLGACSDDGSDRGAGDSSSSPTASSSSSSSSSGSTSSPGAGDFASLSGEEIAAAAERDMKALKSATISGTVTNDGQETTIELRASGAGDCTGSVGVDRGSAELLGVDGKIWIRPDKAFWQSFANGNVDRILQIVGDKWVRLPGADDTFEDFCNLDALLDELFDSNDDGATYEKAAEQEVDGEQVIPVDVTDTDEQAASTGYVRVDSPHYLVRLDRTEGEDSGTLSFSEFDEALDVTAPDPDDVVDLGSVS